MSTECALNQAMTTPNATRWTVVSWCALVAVAGWAYAPALAEMAERWSTSPQYSHGYLVPLFAAFLSWRRRHMHTGVVVDPSWWGLAWVVAGLSLHLAGAHFYLDWANAVSILFVVAGLTMCLGGRKLLLWHWPAIAFLVFMLPLPYRVEVSLAYPLQRLATLASTYALQTLGFAAIAEGNTIVMAEAHIGVVEACNGLGMLVAFFAMSTAVAIVLNRHVVEKALIVLSAVPIALAANVVRITVTGVLADILGIEIADKFFHDLAGWLMMPLALAMLWVELAVLSRLVVEAAPIADPVETLTDFLADDAPCLVSSN